MNEYDELRQAALETSGGRFRVLDEGHYKFVVPEVATEFEVDRLRRERHSLVGELIVRCGAAVSTLENDLLSVGEMNFSSIPARDKRAVYLGRRARTKEAIDWSSLLEELCARVVEHERRGSPSVDLRTMERPAANDFLEFDRLRVPRSHPAILFGDGGSAKSYLALYLLGRMALNGLRVALFDWELAGEDHRDRLERIFGKDMPHVEYARCERPLVAEEDRLRRIVKDKDIDYAAFDSVAFASDGPPEAAEVAGRYFRALRQIGEIGTLHIAHVSKAKGSEYKPFGSTFWHNGARSTWFAKVAETALDQQSIRVGLFNRKTNLGKIAAPVAYEIRFGDEDTWFATMPIEDSPELAEEMTVRQRMELALRRGSMTAEALASAIDARTETVKKTARRHRSAFVLLDGGYVGLKGSA